MMMRRLKEPKYIVIVVLSALFFSACKVTENYTMEEMNLPEEFVLPDSVSQNLDDAIIPWKDFFQDTVLLGLIDSAFNQNFSILTANKEIEINNQYYKQSKAAFLPRLNLNLLNIEREWSSKYTGNSEQEEWYNKNGTTPPENLYISTTSYESTAALDWEVDIWGE